MTASTCTAFVRTVAAASALLAAAGLDGVAGQAVQGQIRDAETRDPITGVEIRLMSLGGDEVARAVSSDSGSFQLLARKAGRYRLEARHPSYELAVTDVLDVGRETVVVELPLTRGAIALDSLVVTARRRDVRRDATWEGFLARREIFPPVGGRRAVTHEDPQMRSAMRVRDVLTWFTFKTERCHIVWWNGSLIHGALLADEFLNDSATFFGGVEYYRNWIDAPMALKDYPTHVSDPMSCAVVVLWPRPLESR